MKAAPFDYFAPETVDEVVAALAEGGDEAKLVAGGQSLLPMMALRLARPSILVDIGRVTALNRITVDGTLTVGAGVTQAALERHEAAQAWLPVLADVLPLVAHPAIRNRGTVGGSIAHADPAAELPAVALLCDAQLVARGPAGERVIAAGDFFESYLTTALRDDEVLTEVRFPPMEGGAAFREVSRRHGDFALVGAGARVRTGDGGAVTAARLVFIGVASTPVAVDLDVADLDAAVGAAVAALDPPGDLHGSPAYRRHVAAVLARDVIDQARSRA